MIETLRELFSFMKARKKHFLLPVVLILIFMAVIMIFGAVTGLAPFIYPFF